MDDEKTMKVMMLSLPSVRVPTSLLRLPWEYLATALMGAFAGLLISWLAGTWRKELVLAGAIMSLMLVILPRLGRVFMTSGQSLLED